jgi:hypothetical protein
MGWQIRDWRGSENKLHRRLGFSKLVEKAFRRIRDLLGGARKTVPRPTDKHNSLFGAYNYMIDRLYIGW